MYHSNLNLVEKSESPHAGKSPSDFTERPLTPIEKIFLLHAERGDCATVRRIYEDHAHTPNKFNVNCVDPLNRSALVIAIENGNIELIKLLLECNIDVKDGLLHAINEEFVEAVEMLLEWEEKVHELGHPYSWENIHPSLSSFTPDVTPLILASHKNNYEIIKILLDRGASVPVPHDVKCGCDDCVLSNRNDSLRHSQARINAYRALTSPSLISLSSTDPLLTAFQLSAELRRLSRLETEFREEYNDMRRRVENFAALLLDHVKTSHELMILLNYNYKNPTWMSGDRQTLDRLKLAIKHKQKQFVAHPNVQQLLGTIWYEGLPGFRRKNLLRQLVQIVKISAMFPLYCVLYMLAPRSKVGRNLRKPFVKFICHSSSYFFFLLLLGAASQRVEIIFLEWCGNERMLEIAEEWKKRERGGVLSFAECGVVVFVTSAILKEIGRVWSAGVVEYISDLWHVVDFSTDVFYVIWFALRIFCIYDAWRIEAEGGNPWYPREEWQSFEPMLISEGAFAAGMIFSFLKLVHIFSVNPHLGPLQISLARMIIDIVKFFFIYTLVLFAFGCGLNQLLWYYAELEKNKCYHLPNGLPDFEGHDKACTIWRRYANLFETSQSLFWASFGLVDLMSFELTGIKSFTRFWALLLFGSYSVINIIVLLNMLIAMMSNSYQIISERADTEWKFARSKLWINYFGDENILPPPFNIFPNANLLCNFFKRRQNIYKAQDVTSLKMRSKAIHDAAIRTVVRRYVTSEQRKRHEFGVTEDDVIEIRQDISSLKYEIINILHENGMRTPNASLEEKVSGKKGKMIERRILKDFQIGLAGSIRKVGREEKRERSVIGHLIGSFKRTTLRRKRRNWNDLVRKNTLTSDPIGTNRTLSEKRRNLRVDTFQTVYEKRKSNSNSFIDVEKESLGKWPSVEHFDARAKDINSEVIPNLKMQEKEWI